MNQSRERNSRQSTAGDNAYGANINQPTSDHPSFDEFVETIARLRAPGGCPWDQAQTHKSLTPHMIEEAYEAVDAIEQNDIAHMREELGDVLLQVVLQSQIAADDNEFTIDDVCADINNKIIRRHPHVFGEEQAKNAEEVRALWDDVKLSEKAAHSKEGLLASVPTSFPALMQAQKISRKAVSVGFEWETLDDIWEQVHEEIAELKEAYYQTSRDEKGTIMASAEDDAKVRHVEEEFGDVLFSLVNVARRMNIDPERALRASCDKFRRRWNHIEESCSNDIEVLKDLSRDELEQRWTNAKEAEQSRESK